MPYSGDPSSSFYDAVRFLLGDTDPTNELIKDAEIAFLQTLYGASATATRIAAYAARMLGHKYAHCATQSIGRVSVSWGELANQMMALALDLETRCGLDAMPYAGGISQEDVQSELDDTDRPAYVFNIGMHDQDAEADEEDIVGP